MRVSMLSRLAHGLCLLLALLLLAGCQRAPLVTQESYVFGTRVEVIVAGLPEAEARAAAAAVLREFDRLHRTYHAWQASELTRLNDAFAAGQSVEVSPEMAALLAEAQQLAIAGHYLFDPGIGGLVKLWGFHADEFVPRLPDPQALAKWQAEGPSLADVSVRNGHAQSRKRGVLLDFGGYLKGVALDRAADILHAHGVRHALINIGGNVLALGNKEGKDGSSDDGAAWRVGIQHPRQPGVLATVALHDGEAIGTSGDYQRYFEIDGRRYCHLLDPRSGQPVAHTQAVTVLIPAGRWAGIRAGTRSDAASKPILIAGPADWRAAAQALDVGLVLRVDASGEIALTKALAARLKFVGEPPRLRLLD